MRVTRTHDLAGHLLQLSVLVGKIGQRGGVVVGSAKARHGGLLHVRDRVCLVDALGLPRELVLPRACDLLAILGRNLADVEGAQRACFLLLAKRARLVVAGLDGGGQAAQLERDLLEEVLRVLCDRRDQFSDLGEVVLRLLLLHLPELVFMCGLHRQRYLDWR